MYIKSSCSCVCVTALYFIIACFVVESAYSQQNDFLRVFEYPSKRLVDSVTDNEVHLLVNRWQTLGLGGQVPRKLEDIPVTPGESRAKLIQDGTVILKAEHDFIKFSLLRGLAKSIKLVWYDENGMQEEVSKSFLEGKGLIYNETRKALREIPHDCEDFENWAAAISSPIIRYFSPLTTISGIGLGPTSPIPPHGIIFDTEKESVFIGITPFGFHLGSWDGNKIYQAKLFYSPELALCLDDYVKKHNLQKFPKIYVDGLTGKDMIQSQIESYDSWKNEKDDCDDVENHETSSQNGKNQNNYRTK